jgi:hypothetical protein
LGLDGLGDRSGGGHESRIASKPAGRRRYGV